MKKQTFAGYGWHRGNWAADGQELYANGVSAAGKMGMLKMELDPRQKAEAPFAAIAGSESPRESRVGRQIDFAAPGNKR